MDNDSDYIFKDDSDVDDGPHIIAMAVVNIASSIAGIIGNCVVLAVIIKNKDHFQGVNLFIAALAITDLIVCTVIQPLFTFLLFGTLPESAALKDFENNVFAILIQISLNLLFSIAIFRITEISKPFFYRSFATKARMLVVIAFVYVISAVQGVLFNRKFFHSAEPFFQYLTIFAFLVIYAIIYRIACKHRNVIASQTRSIAFNHNNGLTETRFAHLRTSTITTGIITGAFVVCFVPFSVVNLIDDTIEENETLLSQWATTIVCCNSFMNAYIYTLRSRNFKNAVAKTLKLLNCFKNE